ncbi:MAG TPA: hypothetical protein VKK79_07395 [Candidatus Lokiarchaeia archaeon]|nr:hypothetical protein [Candidatus Lokiarchaeia archaeon]
MWDAYKSFKAGTYTPSILATCDDAKKAAEIGKRVVLPFQKNYSVKKELVLGMICSALTTLCVAGALLSDLFPIIGFAVVFGFFAGLYLFICQRVKFLAQHSFLALGPDGMLFQMSRQPRYYWWTDVAEFHQSFQVDLIIWTIRGERWAEFRGEDFAGEELSRAEMLPTLMRVYHQRALDKPVSSGGDSQDVAERITPLLLTRVAQLIEQQQVIKEYALAELLGVPKNIVHSLLPDLVGKYNLRGTVEMEEAFDLSFEENHILMTPHISRGYGFLTWGLWGFNLFVLLVMPPLFFICGIWDVDSGFWGNYVLFLFIDAFILFPALHFQVKVNRVKHGRVLVDLEMEIIRHGSYTYPLQALNSLRLFRRDMSFSDESGLHVSHYFGILLQFRDPADQVILFNRVSSLHQGVEVGEFLSRAMTKWCHRPISFNAQVPIVGIKPKNRYSTM